MMERLDQSERVVLLTSLVVVALTAVLFVPIVRRVRTIVGRIHLQRLLVAGKTSTGTKDSKNTTDRRFRGTVTGLFIYPVKSLRAVEVASVTLDSKGFQDDRQFMLITPLPLPIWKTAFDDGEPTHRFLSQRQCPRLAAVTAKIVRDTQNDNGNEKFVHFTSHLLPGDSLRVSTKAVPREDGRTTEHLAKLWDDVVKVQDMGDEASSFFRKLLDADDQLPDEFKTAPVRLVRQSPVDRRATTEAFTPPSTRLLPACENPPVSLVDGFPILIATTASLNELNRRIKAKKHPELPMSRFRPNIVVEGSTMEPFEEDRWKVVSIDGVVFHVVKGCPRCKQSCTDQINGHVYEEPLLTLREFRRMSPEKQPDAAFFAQNAIAGVGMEGRTIARGAKVQVLEWGTPEWGDEQ